jgi:hypothetical protein
MPDIGRLPQATEYEMIGSVLEAGFLWRVRVLQGPARLFRLALMVLDFGRVINLT